MYLTHYTYINIKILEMIVMTDAAITHVRERTGEKSYPYALESTTFSWSFFTKKASILSPYPNFSLCFPVSNN